MFDRWRHRPPDKFEDVSRVFLAHQRLYTTDPESTEHNLRILGRYFAGLHLPEIDQARIEAMIAARLAEGVSKATVNRQRATLSHLFNFAIGHGLMAGRNPVAAIPKFRETLGRTRYLSPDEFARLQMAAAAHLKPILLAAVHTGGRLHELLALTWGDVDLERGFLTFRRETTKSRRERQVPITPDLAGALRRLRPGAVDQFVFTYDERRLVSIRTAFLRACTKAGLGRDVVFHTLRHTFASWYVMNGGDPARLQKYLGHSTPILTQRYTHLSAEFLRDGARYIGPPTGLSKIDEGKE